MHVRNGEAPPGVVAVVWRAGRGGGAPRNVGRPVVVPGHGAVEIGTVAAAVPVEVRVQTFLSLNRRDLRLPLARFDPSAPLDDEQAFVGARPSGWANPLDDIVVDDLDPGFSVTAPREGLRWGTPAAVSTPSDRIAEFGAFRDRRWRRQSSADIVAWGKYRRTLGKV